MAASDKEDNFENFILIINCSKCWTSQDFIKQITNDQFSTEKSSEGLTYHPWSIENKYYCADVKFLVVSNEERKPDWLTKGELQFTALVIIFDQTKPSFGVTKQWLHDLESCDISVLLLVGSNSQQTVTNKDEDKETSSLTNEIIELSIKHSCEFVDLNEEIDPEDDFPDTVGLARVVQALQATEWPSLQMKGETKAGKKTESENKEAGKTTAENNTADKAISQTEFESAHMFDGIIDEPNEDGDQSFDALFAQMRIMKEKAESLPHEERKAYAEQVALAFWKAIGGDEDEVEGVKEK